jgi:hypothetical protein
LKRKKTPPLAELKEKSRGTEWKRKKTPTADELKKS